VHVILAEKVRLDSSKDFQNKFVNIKNLLTFAFQNVQKGDLAEALQLYHKINSLYEELPKGFLYEKAIIYEQILKLFKQVQHTHQQDTSATQPPQNTK